MKKNSLKSNEISSSKIILLDNSSLLSFIEQILLTLFSKGTCFKKIQETPF